MEAIRWYDLILIVVLLKILVFDNFFNCHEPCSRQVGEPVVIREALELPLHVDLSEVQVDHIDDVVLASLMFLKFGLNMVYDDVINKVKSSHLFFEGCNPLVGVDLSF